MEHLQHVYREGLLLGSVVVPAHAKEPLILITSDDRWSGSSMENGVKAIFRYAEENADEIAAINRVLGKTPISPQVSSKKKMILRPSMRYGQSQLWAMFHEEGSRQELHGAIYPLAGGGFINQYRPHVFATVLEAAWDLVALTNPVEYQVILPDK